MRLLRSGATISVITTTMFLLIGCASQPEAPAVDLDAEEAAVRAISQHWQELEAQKDPAGIAALFSENAELLWDQQPFTSGRAAIQEMMAEDMEANPMQTIRWEIERVDMAESGDLATEYGTFTVTNPMDGETEEIEGRYLTVYRKLNGEWAIVADASKDVTAAVIE